MKQFLFLAAFCALFASTSKAQVTSVTIDNQTTCTVYLQLLGATGGACGVGYGSNLLGFPPGITTYSDPSAVPGGMGCTGCVPSALSSTDYFTAAALYDGPSSCLPSLVGYIGESCTFFPTVAGPYNVNDATCSTCASVTTTWSVGSGTITIK